MAISTDTSSAVFTGNGSTVTAYVIPFRFDNPAWLSVAKVTGGVASALTLGSGFTITGQNLKTTVAIPNTSQLRILRNTPALQTVQTSGTPQAYNTALEKQLDETTMALQDLARNSGLASAQDILDQAALAVANASGSATAAAGSATSAAGSAASAASSVSTITGLVASLMGFINRARYTFPNLGIRAMMQKLTRGDDAALLILSDSTYLWLTRMITWLVARFAAIRIEYRLLNAAGNGYDLTVFGNTTNGERRIYIGAGTLWSGFMPCTEARVSPLNAQVMGFDVEVSFEASVLTAGWPNVQIPLHGFGAGSMRSTLTLYTGGAIGMEWFDSTGSFFSFGSGTTIPTLTAGTRYTFRVVNIATDGTNRILRFFYSTNGGATFTAINVSDVTGTPTSFGFDPSKNFFIAGYGGTPAAGVRYYRANTMIGTNTVGTVTSFRPILPERIELFRQVPGQSSNIPTLEGDPTLHIDAIARPGGSISNNGWFTSTLIGTPTLADLLIRPRPYDSCWVNTTHNEVGVASRSYEVNLDTLLALVTERVPGVVPVTLMTQNPQLSPQPFLIQHRRQQAEVVDVAARRNFGLMDVAKAYDDLPDPTNYINSTDKLHPSDPLGYDYIFNTVVQAALLDGLTA